MPIGAAMTRSSGSPRRAHYKRQATTDLSMEGEIKKRENHCNRERNDESGSACKRAAQSIDVQRCENPY